MYHGAPEVSPEVRSLLRWSIAVIAGFVLLLIVDGKYPPVFENSVYGIVVGLMLVNCLVGSAVAYSKRLQEHTAGFKKIIVLGTVCSILLAVIVFLNGYLDHAQPVERSLLLQSKKVLTGRAKTYEFTLESWRGKGTTERLTVSHEEYSKYMVGDHVSLMVHPGALGLPWYERQKK